MKRFDRFGNPYWEKKRKSLRVCVLKRKLQIFFGYHPAMILLALLRSNGFKVSVFKFTNASETAFHLELKDLAAERLDLEWIKTRLRPKF